MITESFLFDMEKFVHDLPGYVYCKNLNSQYILCNNNLAAICGLDSPYKIINKTDQDFIWGAGNANQFITEDALVMRSERTHTSEHLLLVSDRYSVIRTNKKPLYDRQSNLIGVIANALEVGIHSSPIRKNRAEFANIEIQLLHLIKCGRTTDQMITYLSILLGQIINDNMLQVILNQIKEKLNLPTNSELLEFANNIEISSNFSIIMH